jgi:hypothetical protein
VPDKHLLQEGIAKIPPPPMGEMNLKEEMDTFT